MAYQIRANNDNEPFVLDDTAEVLDGITLAASQGDLTIGAVLGEVTATPGTYKLCDALATDGSEIPKLILAIADVDSSGTTTTNLSAYSGGLFDENQLVFGGSTDIDTRLNLELMPNAADRTFNSDGGTETINWANVDVNAYDEEGDLTLTASAADQYCTLPVLSAPTEVGKTYKLLCDVANIVESWTVKDFTGVQTLGTIIANATQGAITWLAETTGGIRIVAVSDGSSGDFDNFKLSRSGDLSDLTMGDALRMLNIRTAPGISVSRYQNPAL